MVTQDADEGTIIDRVLPEDELFEMILTTKNEDGTTNAAPVGVTRSGNHVMISLAESTRSLQNVLTSGNGMLNLVHDPLAFAESAFGLSDSDSFTPDNPVSRLKKAKVAIPVVLESGEEFVKEDRLGPTRFTRLILNIGKTSIYEPPAPFSRANSAAIEAVVAVTRARVAFERGLGDIVEETRESVHRLARVAGNSQGVPANRAFELCQRQLDLMVGGDEGK